MCDKCIELDDKIEHCRKLSGWVVDKPTLEAIDTLITSYRAEKVTLHTEPQ
jgi:hypothetical protein